MKKYSINQCNPTRFRIIKRPELFDSEVRNSYKIEVLTSLSNDGAHRVDFFAEVTLIDGIHLSNNGVFDTLEKAKEAMERIRKFIKNKDGISIAYDERFEPRSSQIYQTDN